MNVFTTWYYKNTISTFYNANRYITCYVYINMNLFIIRNKQNSLRFVCIMKAIKFMVNSKSCGHFISLLQKLLFTHSI